MRKRTPAPHPLQGGVLTYTLAASALIGMLAITGFEMLPYAFTEDASIRIEPVRQTVIVGDIFTIDIMVDAKVPVNVFAGDLTFNQKVLNIRSIDYNTSIANLWAVKPWYENGDGTLNFGGGTTVQNGFIGTGSLIKVTFVAVGAGDSTVNMQNARILKHDGLGTDVSVDTSIDTALLVIEKTKATQSQSRIAVVQEIPSADLNGDGKVSMADASILMLHLLSKNPRYDFNLDGTVDTDDLGILLRTK